MTGEASGDSPKDGAAQASSDSLKVGEAQAGSGSSAGGEEKTVEKLKEEGNIAFTRAQVLRRTTASKQYLSEAKASYIEALTKLGRERADDRALSLALVLHSNLAAVFLLEVPPQWPQAKAAAEIALSVDSKHVKSLFRRGQAQLEDGRQGLPEANLRGALADFDAALAVEPGNTQVVQEAERIRRRVAALEAARRVPEPSEIADRIGNPLKERGGDCLMPHGYIWSQTETLVHIFVPTRKVKLAKSSQVAVEIKSRSLRLALLGDATEAGPLLELSGSLHKPVKPDESSWQLEDGGLLLHVELAKRIIGTEDETTKEGTGNEEEHWRCVWDSHPETKAPSAAQQKQVRQMAHAACRADAEEEKEEDKDPKVKETLRTLREACPGVDIQWGDTSLDAYR